MRAFQLLVLSAVLSILVNPVLAESDKDAAYRYYNEGNYSAALEIIQRLADQDDSWGQYMLGLAYVAGNGVERDSAKAVELWKLAANQGNRFAQFNVGRAYVDGSGVEKDVAEAAKWLLLASYAGLTDAQVLLSNVLRNVDGDLADYWLRMAAINPLATADTQAGDEKRNGLYGQSIDLAAAFEAYEFAANLGDPHAFLALARAYALGEGVHINREKEVEWLTRAVDAGMPEAMQNLATNLRTGIGVKKDEVEALRLFERAALLGFGRSQNDLAGMYLKGIGTPKDLPRALAWYAVAAKGGYEAARQRATDLSAILSPSELHRADDLESRITAEVIERRRESGF